MKGPRILQAVLAAFVAAVAIGATVSGAHAGVAKPRVTHAAAPVTLTGGQTISGVDLHDGTIVQDAGVYYLYGTIYECGYRWGDANSSWCGFGVSTATSLDGPWSAPGTPIATGSPISYLITPSMTDPWSGRTWNSQCIRTNGGGCFNPRVVHNPATGKWLLWFNAVGDNSFDHANAYNVYELASPTGPIGAFNKPRSYTCAACNGDFSIYTQGNSAYLVGTGSNRAEYVELLDSDWKNGTGNIAGHGSSALFSDAEGPGIYRDPTTGYWIMTISHPECGYCSGVRTDYGISTASPIGPWSSPQGAEANPHGGSIAGPDGARNQVSGNSCGGQPRTIVTLDGQAYEFIDLWLGTQNETGASVHLEPLVFRNQADTYSVPWQPFDPWACS